MLGVLLPGLIFSVAENIYEINRDRLPEETETPISSEENKESTTDVDYILVLRENGLVEKMEMETYLVGVLLGELPADFHDEALKAQAVCARTYAVRNIGSYSSHGFDMTNEEVQEGLERLVQKHWENHFAVIHVEQSYI